MALGLQKLFYRLGLGSKINILFSSSISLKLFLSIVFCLMIVYLSIRGIEFNIIEQKFSQIDLFYLSIAFLLFLFIVVLRIYRLWLLVSQLKKISIKEIALAHNVGFLIVVLLPFRLGEYYRSYLIAQKMDKSTHAILPVVILERSADVLVILIILMVTFIHYSIPLFGKLFLFGVPALLILLGIFCFNKYFLNSVNFLNHISFYEKFLKALSEFKMGMSQLSTIKVIIKSFLITTVIWVITVVAIYFLLRGTQVCTDIYGASLVLVVTIFGISVPTSPAFLGNFQFASMSALIYLNINKSEAFFFANVYYVIAVGTYVILGCVCLPFVNISNQWWMQINQKRVLKN
jgi:glycosyltransferase 2 family protein